VENEKTTINHLLLDDMDHSQQKAIIKNILVVPGGAATKEGNQPTCTSNPDALLTY